MAVVVPDLRTALFGSAGPVAASMVTFFPWEISGAIIFRPCQDIVLVRFITAAFDKITVFIQRRSLDDIWRQVQLIKIDSNQL